LPDRSSRSAAINSYRIGFFGKRGLASANKAVPLASRPATQKSVRMWRQEAAPGEHYGTVDNVN
jgi:hypothetical protein